MLLWDIPSSRRGNRSWSWCFSAWECACSSYADAVCLCLKWLTLFVAVFNVPGPWVTPNFMSTSTGMKESQLLCQTLALQPGTIFVSVWQAFTWWWKPLNPPILSDSKGNLLDLENLVSENRNEKQRKDETWSRQLLDTMTSDLQNQT